MATKKKKTKAPRRVNTNVVDEALPTQPTDACGSVGYTPKIERPVDSDAVKLTKQLEETNADIQRTRSEIRYLTDNLGQAKDRLSALLLNSVTLKGQLNSAVDTPRSVA